MAKDQTEVGITGKPVPKPRTAKQQYELEKKRRLAKHLGTNVGGQQYTSGAKYYVPSTGSTNPRARTYREFVEIASEVLSEAPFQIYGPDPHGPSDAEPQPLGKPYQNKKRARRRADELDDKIGGYRHFVRKVD